MKPILIYKGDDTIFADLSRFLTFNIETNLDLTGWKAKFTLGWITKEINDISSKSFEIILSSEETKNLRLGSQSGSIVLTDSIGHIKTITNSIPFEVTTQVVENQYQEINLTIPESSGVDIKLKVGSGIVTSINGKEGDVILTAEDVGALPDTTVIPDISNLATKTELQNGLNDKQDKGDYALKSEIPTDNSQLVNGAGYITSEYHDSTKQDVISDLGTIRSNANLVTTKQDIIPDLATIRSGASKGATALQSYTETDPIYTAEKPNLATKTELQNGLNTKQDKGNYALKSEIPTKVSSLTNDKGYQTASDVAGMIASIPQFSISIVDSLPSSGQKMVLYLVPKTSASGDDIYDEYIWIESTSAFELVGSTTVDLGDYYTKTETNTLLSGKQDKGNYAKTDEANTFTQGQVITTNTSGAILKLSSPAKSTNFILERVNGSQCVLESGGTIGLFGTITEHPLQIRTNYINRMTVGTDGSVVLQHDVSSSSNSNQVATTKWTNRKLSAKLTGVSLTEDEYNALATKDTNTLYLIEE